MQRMTDWADRRLASREPCPHCLTYGVHGDGCPKREPESLHHRVPVQGSREVRLASSPALASEGRRATETESSERDAILLNGRLNRRRRLLLVAYGCAVFALSVLYVPWVGGSPRYPTMTASDYAPIWSPPGKFVAESVDVNRLMIQLTGITLVAGVVFVLLGHRRIANGDRQPVDHDN
jgi:hypothetical protein